MFYLSFNILKPTAERLHNCKEQIKKEQHAVIGQMYSTFDILHNGMKLIFNQDYVK